jgi:hypothetical protein
VRDEHAPGRMPDTPPPTVHAAHVPAAATGSRQAPRPPSTRAATNVPVGWRVAAALVAVASLPAIVWTWFLGVVTFTGCFIKCDFTSADPLGGLLLFTLAGTLLVAGAVCAKLVATGRTAGTARVATISAIAAVAMVLFSAAP